MGGRQLQLQRRDAIVSLTVGEFHLERYATRRFNVCISRTYVTGVRCTPDYSAPMSCVFNGRLMVPVSSGNYKFRESVSLAARAFVVALFHARNSRRDAGYAMQRSRCLMKQLDERHSSLSFLKEQENPFEPGPVVG